MQKTSMKIMFIVELLASMVRVNNNNNGKLRIYFHLLKIDNNKFGFDCVIVLINVVRF